MEKIKTIVIIVLFGLLVTFIIGTFVFKNKYDDLVTRLENVEPSVDIVKLQNDLDRLSDNNQQISLELDIVREERDNAERLEALALEKSNEVTIILNNGLKAYSSYTTSSERIDALLTTIQQSVKKLKEK